MKKVFSKFSDHKVMFISLMSCCAGAGMGITFGTGHHFIYAAFLIAWLVTFRQAQNAYKGAGL
jgi:hypothetical protein